MPGVMPGDSQDGQGDLLDGVRDEVESVKSARSPEEHIRVKSDKEGQPGVTESGKQVRGREESVIGVSSDEEGIPGVTGVKRKEDTLVGVRENGKSRKIDKRNGAHPLPTDIEGGAGGWRM